MSHTSSQRRQQRAAAHSLVVWQRQALVVGGSFLIGIVMEWLRSLPVILEASWRVDTLVVLLAAWGAVILLTWWRETKQWASSATVALVLGALYLGTLMTHVVLTPH